MVKMVFGKVLPKNPKSLAFYMHSDNDQRDDLLFPYIRELLPEFDFYTKSVCFLDDRNKNEWKGVPQAGIHGTKLIADICVCISTFEKLSKTLRDHKYRPYVALVEGEIGRLSKAKEKKIASSVKKSVEWEFHSCVVIVDIAMRRLFVMNPWKEGELRSGTVSCVSHIRVCLVKKLVRRYSGFRIFHTSGSQVHTSDCRIHCLKFIIQMSKLGREESLYGSKIAWKELTKK